jgi:NADH-quinone oxidoreductase subunit C
MQQFDDLLKIVNQYTGAEQRADANASPKIVILEKEQLVAVCRHLYENPETYFDMLSCLTALDNGPQAGTMEIVYNLYSIPFNHHLGLKVILPRENPEVDTVSSIWKTADWHEREAYDLLGIKFIGHPDLRRILLPADWEGFPLRKDYKHQEYYRSIKVEY